MVRNVTLRSKGTDNRTPPLVARESGMTLMELLIVVAIIGILVAVSIPRLQRAHMSANECSALAASKSIVSAQVDYYNNAAPHTYANSLTLLKTGQGAGEVAFLDPALGSGVHTGYTFALTTSSEVNGTYQKWSASCWPIAYRASGIRSFYVDETGVLRGADMSGLPGTIQLPVIQ